MDPVTAILWGAIGLLLLCYAANKFGAYLWQKDQNELARDFRKLMKSPQDTSWDKEWLDAEDKRHRVTAIGRKKLYLFGDITKPVTEGFQWVCSCGGKGVGVDLKMADRNFQKHKKDERETALAAIGRFK